MSKKLSFWNNFSRILFLLLTPAFFRLFNFAFIWHSIYWGVISFVAMLWFLILLIPLINLEQCNLCKRCEQVCLVNIPLSDYLEPETIYRQHS